MAARISLLLLWATTTLHSSFVAAQGSSSERALYKVRAGLMVQMKEVMLASVRTNWEQGTAAMAVLESDDREYQVFADAPYTNHNRLPASTLRFALSAVTRQGTDGRLSDTTGEGDGAALDGASAGPVVLLGTYAQPSKRDFWTTASDRQLNYLLYNAPRTSSGAISHRADSKQYWDDGVFMMPPFIAAYGAVSNNQTLLQVAYDQCRLYRNALRQNGPTGPLWAHIFSDDDGSWVDQGLWSTGNAWAALGMLHVHTTILKSQNANDMQRQATDLMVWTREILDSSFNAINDDNLVPNYVQGGPDFGDAASSAALAAVAYRLVKMHPQTFGAFYTSNAAKLRDAVLGGLDEMGVMVPVVDPLRWGDVGQISTEAQAFGVMMMAAWRDYLGM